MRSMIRVYLFPVVLLLWPNVALTNAQHSPVFKMGEEIAQLIKDGKYDEAERHLAQVGETDPLLIAWLKFKQGNHEESLTILKHQAATATPENVDPLLRSLSILADISVDDAIALTREYLQQPAFNKNQRLQLLLMQLYLRQNMLEQAALLADDVLMADYTGRDLKIGMLTLATSLYTDGQPEKASKYLARLFEKMPETSLDPGFRLQSAHIATAAGRPVDALITLDFLQANHPDYYDDNEGLIRLSKAMAMDAIEKREEAKTELQAVVKLANTDPKFTHLRVIAESKLKEYDQREEAIKSAKIAANRLAQKELEYRPLEAIDDDRTLGLDRKTLLIAVVNAAILGGLVVFVLFRWYRSR